MTLVIFRDESNNDPFGPLEFSKRAEAYEYLAEFAAYAWDDLGDDVVKPQENEAIINRFYGSKNSGYRFDVFVKVTPPFSEDLQSSWDE